MRTLLLVAVAACGGAHLQTLQLVNRTPRAIDAVYIYPQGAADHGKPRASLAPNASAQVRVPQGNIEVLAVSAKFQLDEHTRDKPSASSDLELRAPAEVIFYDVGHEPPEVAQPGVFGIAFQMPKSNAPPPPLTEDPSPEPPEGQ